MAKPAPQRLSYSSATMSPVSMPMKSVSQEMRRSVTAPGEASAAFGSIVAARQPPKNVANTCKKPDPAKDEHKNRIRVEPAIQEISEEAPCDDRGHQDERQFHRGGKLIGNVFRLFF